MTAFAFETISVAQARAYNAATDSLSFAGGVTARQTAFDFNADGTVSVSAAGRAIVFGGGIFGETDFIFADGSRVVLGTPGDDLLVGASTNDALFAGPGNDTLAGGAGTDLLVGGTGSDLYLASGNLRVGIDSIRGWEASDRLSLGGAAATADTYTEMPGPVILASDVNSAASGGRYVAFQSSGYVQVATNRIVGAPEYTDAAVLEGRNLNDIDYSQIVRAPNLVLPPPPPVSVSGEAEPFPTTPPTPAGRTALPAATAQVAGNMDLANLLDIDGVEVDRATATNIDIDNGYVRLTVSGTGFVYDEDDDLVAGIVSSVSFVSGLHDRFFSISLDFNVVPPPVSAVVGPLTQQVFAVVLAGDDAISGGSVINGPGSGTDLLRGYDGNDLISGGGGNDTIFGGTGDDVIYAVAGSNLNRETGSTYLRGDDGADFIVGGLGFDDANGNIGNDTVTTGAGDDYCVGGKDSDLLYGEAGQDIVYGNLGNDSCDGGDGNDIVRGGQDNDVVRGGAGDDFVSGDKGSDTMTGGLGADIFHTFGDAGVDRVTDFSLAQGDRVQLDPGTQYTVSQVGADTVINMTGGGQMVLVGVQMSSLTPGWIFGA